MTDHVATEGAVMIESPPFALATSVALLKQSAGHVFESLSGIAPGDLDRPTPCTGWDLRKLVLHLADVADGLTDLIATGKLALPDPPRSHDADPVAVVLERTDRLLEALDSVVHRAPGSPIDDELEWARTAAHAGVIEFTAHGWDIATTLGVRHEIPAGLATEVLELATALIDDDARQPNFGPRVPVPPTATPGDRLVAFLGRRPASHS